VRFWRQSRKSLIVPVVEQLGMFVELASYPPVKPGDLCYFIDPDFEHLAVVLSEDGKLIHCLKPGGVQYGELLSDSSFSKRLTKIWRPYGQG
jgi:hypothetical protein